MQTATLNQIDSDSSLFFNFDHYLTVPQIGRCKLVAIHGLDASTKEKYKSLDGEILVSLRPVSGSPQFQKALEDNTVFNLA